MNIPPAPRDGHRLPQQPLTLGGQSSGAAPWGRSTEGQAGNRGWGANPCVTLRPLRPSRRPSTVRATSLS